MINNSPVSMIITLGILSLVPLIMVMATSFIKLTIVFSLLRNALGIQQVPSNLAINSLSLALTFYIMAPITLDIADNIYKNNDTIHTDEFDYITIGNNALNIYKKFLNENSDNKEKMFFLANIKNLWPEHYSNRIYSDSLLILLPAFTISELTKAFTIGFLLYLPFIAIDLIISNILLAMGMMMVSPMTISLPFKLLLFTLIDGWGKLSHMLVLSYGHSQ